MKSVGRMVLAFLIVWHVTPLFAGDAAAGKDLFARKCASCHGAAGEGKDSVAKTFKVEMHHLGSKEVQGKSDPDLQKMTLEGTGKMKAVTDLDAKAADDIVAYIRTLAKK